VLRGSLDNSTDEDVIPKWLLRAFGVRGPVIINAREESGDPQEVRTLRRFQVTFDGCLREKCNNKLLGRLEQAMQPIIEPMAVRREPMTLDLTSQRLLAVWAIKTVSA
jgi:hypothetical protein